MVTISTQIDKVMFTSALKMIVIKATTETEVAFSIKQNDDVIFTNKYTPDESGHVYVWDIHVLLNNAIGENVHDTFTFAVANNSFTTIAVKCDIIIGEAATDFINNHFLSPCFHARQTAPYCREMVNILALEEVAVTATAAYYKDEVLSTETIALQSVSGFATIDVSPSLFIAPQKGKLVSYTITAGERNQTYTMQSHNPDAVGVAYRNAFNVYDTFYFNGMLASEWEHTRSTAIVGGRLSVYDIKAIQLFKANTGPIPYGCEVLPYELCRSREVALLDADGRITDDIIITDADIKADNAPDTINDFIITYRIADQIGYKVNTPKSVKLFDDTFDGSFN